MLSSLNSAQCRDFETRTQLSQIKFEWLKEHVKIMLNFSLRSSFNTNIIFKFCIIPFKLTLSTFIEIQRI